ncbi:hypothetical protein [Streptomyces sp. WM6368]|uniref:hypothetical protein n=1 Tax=Streptomyces sp. WM6368 TaxID=1415554 RepID=UPI0006AFF209|nr:hypothetical protein [Streptomyces sp. WM6368]KOU19430.1 hypothetical protein ADK51_27215 [Streptomyces sp. WM6368]
MSDTAAGLRRHLSRTLTATELLTSHLAVVHQSYLDNFDPLSVLFFAIGAYAAFRTARKAA